MFAEIVFVSAVDPRGTEKRRTSTILFIFCLGFHVEVKWKKQNKIIIYIYIYMDFVHKRFSVAGGLRPLDPPAEFGPSFLFKKRAFAINNCFFYKKFTCFVQKHDLLIQNHVFFVRKGVV